MRPLQILVLAWLGIGATHPCTVLLTEQSRTDRDSRVDGVSAPDTMRVVIGSNNSLRFYNNQVFKGWTLGSEYMSQLQHHLLVRRLVTGTDQGWILNFAETPYTKNVQLAFISKGHSIETLSAALIRARTESTEDIVRMIYEPLENSGISSSRLPPIKWQQPRTEEMIPVPKLDQHDMTKLREALKKQFPTEDDLRKQLNQNYSLGIGHNELDAQFAAKLSSNTGTGGHPIIEFSLSKLSAVLDGIENQRKRLGDKFNGLSDEELLKLFTKLRQKSYDSDPQKIQKIEAEIKEMAMGEQPPDFSVRLSRYIRTLNFLDYLPREWFAESDGAAAAFDQLRKTRFLIYADIRGLGAGNLLQLHKQSSALRAKVIAIRELDAVMLQDLKTERQDLVLQREELLNELYELRSKILSSSNDRVQEVQDWLRITLRDAEIQDSQFAVWNGGDDLIVAVQNENFENARSFIKTLKSSESFPSDLRLAVMRLDQTASFSLADSRTAVAEIMHELKFRQASNDDINFAWGSLTPQAKLNFEFGTSADLQ